MGTLMNLKRILVGLTTLAAVVLTASLTLAQEATAAATEAAPAAPSVPPGGGLLFLLIGLGAIVLMAVIWLVRERIETTSESLV